MFLAAECDDDPTDPDQLADLEIHAAGSPVSKLFTDHPLAELNRIGDRPLQSIGRK